MHDIDSHTEISVSPEDDVEVRRVTLTNHSHETRTIEVTSYAEVVLNTRAADLAHPAFSNLFVQTKFSGRSTPSFAHAARGRPAINCRACSICCWHTARKSGEHRMKLTAHNFWDAAELFSHRGLTGQRCVVQQRRLGARSRRSPFVAPCGSHPKKARASLWFPASPRVARRWKA
jgi:hypothetical protein